MQPICMQLVGLLALILAHERGGSWKGAKGPNAIMASLVGGHAEDWAKRNVSQSALLARLLLRSCCNAARHLSGRLIRDHFECSRAKPRQNYLLARTGRSSDKRATPHCARRNFGVSGGWIEWKATRWIVWVRGQSNRTLSSNSGA